MFGVLLNWFGLKPVNETTCANAFGVHGDVLTFCTT